MLTLYYRRCMQHRLVAFCFGAKAFGWAIEVYTVTVVFKLCHEGMAYKNTEPKLSPRSRVFKNALCVGRPKHRMGNASLSIVSRWNSIQHVSLGNMANATSIGACTE